MTSKVPIYTKIAKSIPKKKVLLPRPAGKVVIKKVC